MLVKGTLKESYPVYVFPLYKYTNDTIWNIEITLEEKQTF